MQGAVREPVRIEANGTPLGRGLVPESLAATLGLGAAVLAVAGGYATAGGRPWAPFALAAGAPMPLDQAAAVFRAIQANQVWWPVLSLVVVGGIAGALARYVVPNTRAGGSLGSLFLGVFSAAMGGWVCQRMGAPLPADVTVLNIGVAFAIAVVTLMVGKLIARL